MGSAVAASLGEDSVAGSTVGGTAVIVGAITVGSCVAAGGSTEVAVAAGAQEAIKTASRVRLILSLVKELGKELIFIIFL
jgi:hypothetical protein